MSFCRECGNRLSSSADDMPSAADVVSRQSARKPKIEAKPEAKPEARPEARPEAGPEARIDAAPHAATQPGPRSAPAGAPTTCPRCAAATPPGYRFCQECGAPLGSAPQPVTPPSPRTIPPDGRPPGVRNRGHDAPEAIAATLAVTSAEASGVLRAAHELARKRTYEEDPAVVSTLPETPLSELSGPAPSAAAAVWGRLILVRQDGSDGRAYPLLANLVELGRTCDGIQFEADRSLAPVHARLERAGDALTLHPIDTINGVYRRLAGAVALADGDCMVLGRELLRFERVDADERNVAPLVQDGIVRLGSPAREPWGRLRLLLANGGWRDVRFLRGAEYVLGREDGDWRFPDDEYMSRRHAVLRWDGGSCQLEDLASSNGTFVRLRGSSPLSHGDHLRMGNQLLRLELSNQT